MTTDGELLGRYAKDRAEEAFAELVRRHLNLVYSAALRQVNGDTQLAQDVAQTVFTDLARKAASLLGRPMLTGWLYTSTHFAAANAVRGERRRQAREQEAHTMRELLHEPQPDLQWETVLPALDAAMLELKETDRDAILLRFFENRPLADVGGRLGLSEDAARKKVERAVDKLRALLTQRGITSAAAGLGTVLSTNAVQVAPTGLAATISTTVLTSTMVSTSAPIAAATKTIAMTALQKTIVATSVAALVAIGGWEALLVSRLRDQNRTLHEREGSQAGQIEQLQRERDKTANRLAALADEMQSVRGNSLELLKLRNEIGQLRQQAALDRAKAKSPGEAVANLMSDSSAVQLARVQLLQTLKNAYAPLVQQLNLSPETTDKLFNLIVENELKKKVMYAQLLSGDLDITTALQNRDTGKMELDNQIAALLGDTGFSQFDQFYRDTAAGELVKGLNRELGALALNEEQSRKIQKVFAAKPDITMDDMDLFRSRESLEALFQAYVDRGHRDLQEAAGFLTPEQLTAARTIQSNHFNTLRTQMALGHELVSKTVKQGSR